MSASTANFESRLPLVRPLPERIDPVHVFQRLLARPHCIFLDSAQKLAQLGRYSFVASDPFQLLNVAADKHDPFEGLQAALMRFAAPRRPDLPPFQGGAAGLFGYELNRALEPSLKRNAIPAFDEFSAPALCVGLYDVVAAFDHQEDKAWLISTGFPELDEHARQLRARERLEAFCDLIENDAQPRWRSTDTVAIDNDLLLGRSHTTSFEGVLSNFNKREYLRSVQRAVEYIHAGDIFQVNMSQRLLHRSDDDPLRLYLRLRERNAAPFAGYFETGRHQIVSASPERFVSVRQGLLETRPIKGTRPRALSPEADLFAASDLRGSEKDNAENVMIVDLLRNDISRVCDPESVMVRQLCEVENYAYVQHLVSSVEGRLRQECNLMDVIRATFPGGSITGAPKIRAMEIIAELEQTARGAYCGSLGYLGFNGEMDLSILIRTITASGGWWQLPVGGGVVAQSKPENEYQETWDKAAGLLRSLHR